MQALSDLLAALEVVTDVDDLAPGDSPKGWWGATGEGHVPQMSLTEWTKLKACGNYCTRCGAQDDLDAWGRWHVPQHRNHCLKNRGAVARAKAAAKGHPSDEDTVIRPMRRTSYDQD